jgi:septal ring factor EnvC (AmiA/AmiB activator)
LLASIPPPPPALPPDAPAIAEPQPAAAAEAAPMLASAAPPVPAIPAKPEPAPAVARRFHAEHANSPFEQRKGDLEVPVRGTLLRAGEEGRASAGSHALLVRSDADRQVVAVARGEVVFAGPFPGLGRTVIINHGDRFHTVYAHLESIACEVGARVRESEVVGTLTASQPTLRFELRAAGKTQDALAWFKGGKEAFVP